MSDGANQKKNQTAGKEADGEQKAGAQANPALKRAVALRYSKGQENVPTVVAKGQGLVAESIIRKAQESGIHIHEDPSLVEVLSKLDLDEQIPSELYELVAEVLSFVYRIDSRSKETLKTLGQKKS
jgi:flagellar biosynthesis protein